MPARLELTVLSGRVSVFMNTGTPQSRRARTQKQHQTGEGDAHFHLKQRRVGNHRRGIKGARDVQQDRRSHFCRDRISYREERKEGGDGVIANKEETESEELQAGDSKENRRRQG